MQGSGEVGPVRVVPRGVVRLGRHHLVDGVPPRVEKLVDDAKRVIQQSRLLVANLLHHELHEACKTQDGSLEQNEIPIGFEFAFFIKSYAFRGLAVIGL